LLSLKEKPHAINSLNNYKPSKDLELMFMTKLDKYRVMIIGGKKTKAKHYQVLFESNVAKVAA